MKRLKEDYMSSASVEMDLTLNDYSVGSDRYKHVEVTDLETVILSWNTMPDGVNLGIEPYQQLIDSLENHIANSHPHLGNVEWSEFGYFKDDDGTTIMGIRLSFQSDFKLRHWIFAQFTHVYNREYVGDPNKAFVPF